MEQQTVDYHFYINGVFSNFIRGIADFFKSEWYGGRVGDVIISTYEKAVQHIQNRRVDGSENYSSRFPFMVIDPNLEFEPEERMGKFQWAYPNLAAGLATQVYSDIYDDGTFRVTPVLNRYKGTMDITVWCSSVSEYIDFRAYTYQHFGGLDKIIYPTNIEGELILPDEYVTYSKSNPYTGVTHTMDWDTHSTIETMLIKNINRDKYYFPFEMRPWLTLRGVSNGSDKYGGSGDEIGDHRLVLSIEWEASLPVHMVLTSSLWPEPCHKIIFDLGVGVKYVCDDFASDEIFAPNQIVSIYSDSTDAIKSLDIIYKNQYSYDITSNDVLLIADDENIEIPIPGETITDCIYLKVYGKYGMMERDLHWRLKTTSSIELIGFNMDSLEEGDTIYMIVYRDDDKGKTT